MRMFILFPIIASIAAACGGGNGPGDAGTAGHPGGGGGNGGITVGGKSDAAPGACSAASPAGATMSWMDNGAAECAYLIVASRMTDSTQDFLEIIGSTTSGLGVGITVVSYGSPLGGTYHCKSDAGVLSVYVDFTYSGMLVDCTITITNPGEPGGANAVGTFSATLNPTGGGATSITNGIFNTPVTPTTG